MTIDEMITVLQAYKEGKTIQFKPRNQKEWTTLNAEPIWLFPFCDYRVAQDDDEFIEFKDLEKHGIKAGDIVACPSLFGGNEICDYYLLRNGLPTNFNTALCCNILPNGKMHLYQIGFTWQGEVKHKFRKTTEEERQKFIDACIEALKDKNSTWRQFNLIDQILANMIKWNLITKENAKKLNKSLIKIHGEDILKKAKYWM